METELRDYFGRTPIKGDTVLRSVASSLEKHEVLRVTKTSLILKRNYNDKPLRWYPYRNFIIIGRDDIEVLQ